MWIVHEPKKIALRNKRHFEEKNGECAACLKYSVLIFVEKKYIKCNIWRVAVCPFYIWDARFLKVKVLLGTVLAAKYPGNCKLSLRLSSRVYWPRRGRSVFYRTEKYHPPYTGVPFRVSLGTVLAAKYPGNCKLSMWLSSHVHGPSRSTSVFYRTEKVSSSLYRCPF